jgi:hypothetical protein
MIPTNLGDKLQVMRLIPAAAITADGNGTGVDLQEYSGEMCAILDSAAGTGDPDNTLDVKLQDSADNSSFADVSGLVFTQVTDTAGIQKLSFNKDEVRRYVRAVKDVGGTTPSFVASCSLVGLKKYG